MGVTGASGSLLAERFLLRARELAQLEIHLVVSHAALITARSELGRARRDWCALAHFCYSDRDLGAVIASGSFPACAMVVIPCSMKTLAAIAHGYGATLIARAAEVSLKERRPLILAVRETPLSLVQIRNMQLVAEAGAVVMPPLPAYYTGVQTLLEAADQFACRVLALLGFEHPAMRRWQGQEVSGAQVEKPAQGG